MVFSNTTTRAGLIQDCEDLCKLGATGISGNATLLLTFTRYLNNWYSKTVAWIIEAQGTWEFDDFNYTDLPIGTATLVAGQQDYTLPVSAQAGASATSAELATTLKIVQVDVKDSNGDYQKLTCIDETNITGAISEFEDVDGMPKDYRVIANSIELYPAPAAGSVTTTAGLKVYFQRSPEAFVSTDTTQAPGFPDLFHRIISLGASYDYTFDPKIRQEIEQLKTQMQEFYSQRNRDFKIRIKPRIENYR